MIRICGTVTVDEEEIWELPSGVSIRRAEDFEDALVRVTGCLKLDNVRLYTEDITGDGEVEGAAEKEKVYVPKVITVKVQKHCQRFPWKVAMEMEYFPGKKRMQFQQNTRQTIRWFSIPMTRKRLITARKKDGTKTAKL